MIAKVRKKSFTLCKSTSYESRRKTELEKAHLEIKTLKEALVNVQLRCFKYEAGLEIACRDMNKDVSFFDQKKDEIRFPVEVIVKPF
jgi:hypothetical protein